MKGRELKMNKKYIIKEMMILKEERRVLTNDGKLFTDGIASDLFIDSLKL